jgi:tryptophan 2,3-dioxygenase
MVEFGAALAILPHEASPERIRVFMVVLHELEIARSAMDGDDVGEAVYRLERVARIEDVLVTQITTLESLSPASFLPSAPSSRHPAGCRPPNSGRSSSCPAPRTPAISNTSG